MKTQGINFVQVVNVELDVLVNGKPVKKYYKDGKCFIKAIDGQKFTLRVKNNEYNRKLGIVSVDGINVIDGKENTEDSRGYILSSKNNLEVKGWREDLNKVREFVFKLKGDSYRKEVTNETINCGVIGLTCFNEVVKPTEWVITTTPWITWGTCNNKNCYCTGACQNKSINVNAFYSSSNFGKSVDNRKLKKMSLSNESHDGVACMDAVNFDMGTGHGKQVESKVSEEEFERGILVHTQEIFYASENALREMGVELEKKDKVELPKSIKFNNFCNFNQ